MVSVFWLHRALESVPLLNAGGKDGLSCTRSLCDPLFPPGELPRCIIVSAHGTAGNSQLPPLAFSLYFQQFVYDKRSRGPLGGRYMPTHMQRVIYFLTALEVLFFFCKTCKPLWIAANSFPPPQKTNGQIICRLQSSPKRMSALCCCSNQFSSIRFL